MSDVLRAVDEIVDVLCKHLGPQVLNQDVASDIDIDRHDDFRSDMQEVAADILALPTLRAALAPPADGEVDVIRQRHEADSGFESDGLDSAEWRASLTMLATRAHTDRATLLRHVSRLSAELARERERRAEVEKLVRVLLENDPDDAVSDGGHTVLDLWRREARATLTKD